MDPERFRLNARELQLEHPALQPVVVHGLSMFPFLRDGDQLFVAPVAWDGIRPGDILTYRFEDKFPARRVVAREANRLRLRADNWARQEFEVAREDVLGRVVARRRRGVIVTRDDWRWIAWSRLVLVRYRARRLLAPLRRWWEGSRRPGRQAGGQATPVV